MATDNSAAPKRRGRPSRISTDQIVKHALEAGVDGLSMHGVAKALGVSATALYRHVSSKEVLVAMCVDYVLTDMAEVNADNWADYLTTFARELRLALLKYPGSVAFIRQVGLTTPAALAQMDLALGKLKAEDFSAEGAFMAVAGVISHVTDMVMHEEQPTTEPGEDLIQQLSQLPNVLWAMSENLSMDHQKNFECGLEIIIEGVRVVNSI